MRFSINSLQLIRMLVRNRILLVGAVLHNHRLGRVLSNFPPSVDVTSHNRLENRFPVIIVMNCKSAFVKLRQKSRRVYEEN